MKKNQIIVAIDGPAGAGKSTTARLVAKRLGFFYVDTGALYRALTLKVLRQGIATSEVTAIEHLAATTKFDVQLEGDQQKVLLDGEDVTNDIRSQEVTNNIGPVSELPRVRELLVQRQRDIALNSPAPGVVMEGRDIGTVVFPEADVKIFMRASIDVRTRRRQLELAQRGVVSEFGKLREEILQRDRQDVNRAAGALRRAREAVELDTTTLSIAEQVDYIVEAVRQKECV